MVILAQTRSGGWGGTTSRQCFFSSCSPSSVTGDKAFPKNMIGPASEGLVKFDNKETVALLDTGSQISMVSRSFCNRCSLEVRPLSQFFSL